MRISDWSSDVCSSDLRARPAGLHDRRRGRRTRHFAGAAAGRLQPGPDAAARPGVRGRRNADDLRRGDAAAAACRTDRQRRFFTGRPRSEEHTSELQSLMRISYAVFCLKKKKKYNNTKQQTIQQKLLYTRAQ